MSLHKIRKRIDDIDKEILMKINTRMELALKTKNFKRHISVRKRETQVLEQVKRHATNLSLIESEFAEKIFNEFIKESRRLQGEKE